MALMVTVNEFWKFGGIPHALEHFAVLEDGMGLSDIVYPMFLFAMGMSVPLALDAREARGCSAVSTLGHILSRTLALLVMGTFIVNVEGTQIAPLPGYSRGVFYLLMVAGFFLVWNRYSPEFRYRRLCRGLGIALLLFLALTFRSTEGALMRGSWWGILGQIGWMYLFTSLAYMLTRGRGWILALLWVVFALVNISVTPLREGGMLIGENVLADLAAALNLGNGHSVLMSLGGCITVLAGRRLAARSETRNLLTALSAAVVFAALGILAHRGWIISKGLGTLPWVLFVTAISVALYAMLRVLERHGLTRWAAPIRPAGTATLTVYMIPYFFIGIWILVTPTLPAWYSGMTGVALSVAYAGVCIGITWLLGKVGIMLKI